MNTLRSFTVLAALSLAGAACAQTQLPSNMTAQRNDPTHMAAASSGKVDSGMRVRSSSGDLLGTVASIIPSDSGNDAYVVIADLQGIATPVPYRAASAMVQRDMLVVDESRFANAPKVQQYQTEDGPRGAWEKKADSYWKQSAMSSEANGVRHE